MISIHLMLLFITKRKTGQPYRTDISIHLMLLFIVWDIRRRGYLRYISIHLMLLFIVKKTAQIGGHNKISIHLMLLFISSAIDLYQSPIGFQYISCYCLSRPSVSLVVFSFISIHLMLLFIHYISIFVFFSINFNTSHVTVYLSACNTSDKRFLISIHLMLLFIKKGLGQNPALTIISIHLMLLFILSSGVDRRVGNVFQYISCYCLSCVRWFCKTCKQISIHLMLLFIGMMEME